VQTGLLKPLGRSIGDLGRRCAGTRGAISEFASSIETVATSFKRAGWDNRYLASLLAQFPKI